MAVLGGGLAGLLLICTVNRTEWSPIQSVIIRSNSQN